MKASKKNINDFTVLTSMLGIDQDSLLEYVNWCLLEHLATTFSLNKELIKKIKNDKNAIAQFKKVIENRTQHYWDVENTTILYDYVKSQTENHYRNKVTYQELLRLLINSPLECTECGAQPPNVKLHIDHIFPVSKGGSSNFENLQFLCEKHNLSKSNKVQYSKLWIKLESLLPY